MNRWWLATDAWPLGEDRRSEEEDRADGGRNAALTSPEPGSSRLAWMSPAVRAQGAASRADPEGTGR